MLVVGLTGGIATGKSTVSSLLKNRELPIIDADILARKAVEPGSSGLRAVVKTFGTDVLLPDGSLDRKKLGEKIFADEQLRKKLNAIIHPRVRWGMFKGIIGCWLRGKNVCIVDVPLLVESKLWKWVGFVIVVYCSPETQLRRLQKRDSSTEEAAQARISSQLPIAAKLPYADAVLDNSSDAESTSPSESLKTQVDDLIAQLHKKSNRGVPWWLCWTIPPVGALCAVIKIGRRTWAARSRASAE